MRLLRIRCASPAIGLAVGLSFVLCWPAHSAPLSVDADHATESRAVLGLQLSETDPVLREVRHDLIAETLTSGSPGEPLGPLATRRSASARTNGREAPRFDFGHGTGTTPKFGGPMHGVTRDFLTARSATATETSPPARTRSGTPNEDLGLDLGLGNNMSVRDTLKNILASVLHLTANERGHASFSVLGLRDFGSFGSDEQADMALTAGESFPLSGRRYGLASESRGAPSSYAHLDAKAGQTGGTAGSTGYMVESPLRRLLELALEIVSHPLSFVAYALIASYALMYALLSGRAKRPLRVAATSKHAPRHSANLTEHRSSGEHRSSRGHRSTGEHQSSTALPTIAPIKKRMRVRLRMRKHRG
jgi:hypothetical protein